MQVTSDLVNTIDETKVQLFKCTTKEAAEEVFERSKISDIAARITLLNRCMRVEDSYGIPGENKVTKEDFYKETLEFFEDGQWRNLI